LSIADWREQGIETGDRLMDSLKYHFVDPLNKVSYRSNSKNPSQEPFVLIFYPGGPAIEGKYLDQFAMGLAGQTGSCAVVFDLPNHGQEAVDNPSINYPEAVSMLFETLEGQFSKSSRMAVIGHSFGAYIALSMAELLGGRNISYILISTPEVLGANARLDRAMASSGLADFPITNEESFRAFWMQLLPLYFYRPPDAELVSFLSQNSFYEVTKNYLDASPRLSDFRLDRAPEGQFLLVDGEEDILRRPDGAKSTSLAALPVESVLIPEAGHFPMIESLAETIDVVASFINRQTGE
jgi:pimeloyl-ACP methyl ester carboxylesterase